MRSDQQKDVTQGANGAAGKTPKSVGSLAMGYSYHILHAISWAVIFLISAFIIGLVILQTGLADGLVSNYAQRAFDSFSSQDANVKVDNTVLRLTGDGHLAVEARDVLFANNNKSENSPALKAGSAQMKIDPVELLFGRTEILGVHVSDVFINLNDLPVSSKPNADKNDNPPFRIDSLDEIAITLFKALENLDKASYLQEAEEFSIENIELFHPSFTKLGGVIVESAIFKRNGQIFSEAEIDLFIGDDETDIELKRDYQDGRDIVHVDLLNVAVDFETPDPNPEVRSGLITTLDAALELEHMPDTGDVTIRSHVKLDPGSLKMGGELTALNRSDFYIEFDQNKQSIELNPRSYLSVSRSNFPLTGGIIDASNINETQEGYAYDILLDQGFLDPTDTEEQPIIFSAKSFGFFKPTTGELLADELLISVGNQFVAGNGKMLFSNGQSPEINLAVNAPEISTSSLKQLWPYWLGRGARNWALNNIFGGTIKDADFWLRINAGRLSNPERPIRHAPENYQVNYKFENARVNVVGDVPPIRNANGSLSIRGEVLEIAIQSGTSFFPTGRKIDIDPNSKFIIPNTNNVPLMAELDLNLSGQADAAAELLSFEPINALDTLGITPEQTTGLVEGNIKLSVGLNPAQSPPDPLWSALLNLTGVDLAKPIEDRVVTNVVATADVNQKRAIIEGAIELDGIAVNASVVEPIGGSNVEKKLYLEGTLNNAQRAKLGLGVENILFGNASFTMERLDKARDQVSINLNNTEVVAPGTGWKKAKGIPAKITFVSTRQDDTTALDDFRFSGDGFLAVGNMVLDDDGLRSAQFDRVKLAPKDNYSLSVKRQRQAFNINISGESFDFRPLITELKKDGDKDRRSNPKESSYNLTGSLKQVFGFGGETLTNAEMEFQEIAGIPRMAKFSGRTRNQGSVAMQLTGDESGEAIKIASDDGGTFWRFFDIYAYVQDGALDINVAQSGNGPYKGQVLMRDFKVIGDERLKTLVSTRASAKERSLNDALNGRLDVSRVTFDQTIVDFSLNNSRLDVSSGIIRGPQIGASFDGMLYDADDKTDMSGTFMPAYALNSIFGEIPVLGALLGNGRDKALLGITFRVSGDSDDPNIQVNPLSAIAPGIFRNIFQF